MNKELLEDYIVEVKRTINQENGVPFPEDYYLLGLFKEGGELVSLLSKHFYYNDNSEELRNELLLELGDVYWFVVAIYLYNNEPVTTISESNYSFLQAINYDIIDAISRVITYNNLEFLGDITKFLLITAHHFGFTEEEVINANIKKTQKRYPNGFEVDKSENRIEKPLKAKSISEIITKMRKRKKLGQNEAAKLLTKKLGGGFLQSNLTVMESGKQGTSLKKLKGIAKVLGFKINIKIVGNDLDIQALQQPA